MAGVRLGLAGDTMLGRGVAERLSEGADPRSLVAPEVVAVAREADLFVLNLECCISDRGAPWPAPGKAFFFRAPPRAVETLSHLGTTAVTLANNHALDHSEVGLLDTLGHLEREGIRAVGAGPDASSARSAAILEGPGGFRVALLGVADHPPEFAATEDRPGIAYADLAQGVPGWLRDAVAEARTVADAVVVTPHWGPNMVAAPVAHVRRAAALLVEGGASLVVGHSAHVFHGVAGRVLFDLGDLLDDYAVDPVLRNDLGLLWLVDLGPDGPAGIEAVPLRLEYCHTRLAEGEDAAWVRDHLRSACAEFGATVAGEGSRLVVTV